MYESGRGLAQGDLGQAAELYERACQKGHAEGCRWRAAVIDKLRRSCELPGGEGCTNLGYIHERGVGVPSDLQEAARFYRLACDAGRPIGCSNLGVLYDQGRGAGQDYAMAAKLYQKACDKGGATGCANLGYLLEKGLGTKKPDGARALALYRKG